MVFAGVFESRALPTSRAKGATWKASKAFSEGFNYQGQMDLPLL
jgi:hypothetical protein